MEAFNKLYAVHFPRIVAEEITWKMQGQPNLGTYTAHRADWELNKRAINDSKVTWAINTFK
jgi:hypothetical protein